MGLVCSRVVLEANWDLTWDIEPMNLYGSIYSLWNLLL